MLNPEDVAAYINKRKSSQIEEAADRPLASEDVSNYIINKQQNQTAVQNQEEQPNNGALQNIGHIAAKFGRMAMSPGGLDPDDPTVLNAILGAGDTTAKVWSGGHLGGVGPLNESDAGYNVGKMVGNVAAYAIPNAILPGSGLRGIAGGLRNIAGGALYGAAAEPDNRLWGATKGAMFGAGAEVLPAVAAVGKNVSSLFRPQQVVTDFIEAIPQRLKQVEGEKNANYNAINSRVGDSDIYSRLEGTKEEGKYLDLDENDLKSTYDPDLKKANAAFYKNPTYNNANTLQQELGKTIRDYESNAKRSGKLIGTDRTEYMILKTARNALISDMKGFLGRVDPVLEDQFNAAKDHFIDEVLPNRTAKSILDKVGPNPTPTKILRAFDKAKQQGETIPDYVEGLLSDMQFRQKAQQNLQRIGGGILGYGVFRHAPFAGEIGGALLGAMAGKPAANILGTVPWGAASKLIGNVYRPASQAAITNLLGQ